LVLTEDERSTSCVWTPSAFLPAESTFLAVLSVFLFNVLLAALGSEVVLLAAAVACRSGQATLADDWIAARLGGHLIDILFTTSWQSAHGISWAEEPDVCGFVMTIYVPKQ